MSTDNSCGSLYFYWRFEALKPDGSNLPEHPRARPPKIDPKRYFLIKSSGYYPSEVSNEHKLTDDHLVKQGYLDLREGHVVFCSRDDEPWGLTHYSASLVRQGAASGRFAGDFLILGPSFEPFWDDDCQLCGPGGQWFLVPSQASACRMRSLMSFVARAKDKWRRAEAEKLLATIPSVQDLLQSVRLKAYTAVFAQKKYTSRDLVFACDSSAEWKCVVKATGLKPGHSARLRRRIRVWVYRVIYKPLWTKDTDSVSNQSH